MTSKRHANNIETVVQRMDVKDIQILLKKAMGQIQAIIDRLEYKKYRGQNIITQLSAVSAAIQGVHVKFVEEYTKAKVLEVLDGLSETL